MKTSAITTALKKTVLIAVAVLLAATAIVAANLASADAGGGVLVNSNGGPLEE